MTYQICSHHFGGILWGIGITLSVIGMVYSITIPPVPDPYDQPMDKFNQQEPEYMNYLFWHSSTFMFVLMFVMVNLTGIIVANGRYHWIGLKECSR